MPSKWSSSEWSYVAITLGLLLSAPAGAATVSGRITSQGAQASGAHLPSSYGKRSLKFIKTIDYENLQDFVIYLVPDQPTGPRPSGPTPSIMQKNAIFEPRVLPVQVGTTVEFPNEDDIYHNVFSFSNAKPFDLGLYKNESKSITFEEAGRIDVFCAIHKDMSCIILVLDTPWFTVADKKGRYSFRDIPAGSYQLVAWHERLPEHREAVTVLEEDVLTIDITMGMRSLPKY